jgi:hypothetical protein
VFPFSSIPLIPLLPPEILSSLFAKASTCHVKKIVNRVVGPAHFYGLVLLILFRGGVLMGMWLVQSFREKSLIPEVEEE